MKCQIGVLSHQILTHAGLMTPVLQAAFGDIVATGVRHRVEGNVMVRHSTLVQQASQKALLNATLRINMTTVPAALVETLLTTQTPFGQLLADYSISAYATDRNLVQKDDEMTNSVRWGRRLDLRSQTSRQILCAVEELLVSEQALNEIVLSAPIERT